MRGASPRMLARRQYVVDLASVREQPWRPDVDGAPQRGAQRVEVDRRLLDELRIGVVEVEHTAGLNRAAQGRARRG